MKITIFAIPKPFVDQHISTIQRNAILSWKTLPDTDVLIIGDEENIESTTRELGVAHINRVERIDGGLPLLSAAFAQAREYTGSDILIYANSDIIFLNDLVEAAKLLPSGNFLGVGRRVDLDITEQIDFKMANAEKNLRSLAQERGSVHSPAGIDYFVFRKNMLTDMPPLVVGRIGWDNWMIWNAKQKNIPVIDMTKSVLAIHQNHPPRPQNSDERKTNKEALHNISFIKGRGNAATIDDANWRLVGRKLVKNHLHFLPHLKRFVGTLLK
jgi:hypothetical protein